MLQSKGSDVSAERSIPFCRTVRPPETEGITRNRNRLTLGSRLIRPAAWDSLTRFRREADRAARWNAAIGSITQFNT